MIVHNGDKGNNDSPDNQNLTDKNKGWQCTKTVLNPGTPLLVEEMKAK
jgi:hypothetical protein